MIDNNKNRKIFWWIYLIVLIIWVFSLFTDILFSDVLASDAQERAEIEIVKERAEIEDNTIIKNSVSVEKDIEAIHWVSPQTTTDDLVNDTERLIFQEDKWAIDIKDIKINNNIDEFREKKEHQNKIEQTTTVQELISQYEFKKAWNELSDINIYDNNEINKERYLYTYFNNLSLDNSTDEFIITLETLKNNNQITYDTYNFYMGLINYWNWEYDLWNIKFSEIQDNNYLGLIDKLIEIKNKIELQKDIPLYYQDALFSLELFKNWYFSIAKRLSLKAINSNKEYILPYQIFAYSSYLTNQWEPAIEYFLLLQDLDTSRYSTYKFMIWTSYFRLGKYTDSILYLSQIGEWENQTDVYRYLILNYKKINQTSKIADILTKMISQPDLNIGDFELINDIYFLDAYKVWQKSDLYNTEQWIGIVKKCYELFSSNPVCDLWTIWLYISKWEIEASALEDKVNKLISMNPSSILYQVLWDINWMKWNKKKAKNSYIKAYGLTANSQEQSNIKIKLKNLLNQ